MCEYCNTANYRKIYEAHVGPIPKDESGRSYDIHHKDGNHQNNTPENLQAVSLSEHYNIHFSQEDWSACQLISLRLDISPEERSSISRLTQLKRVSDGTHPFLKKSEDRKTWKPSTRVSNKIEEIDGMRPLCDICNSRPVAINYYKNGIVHYRKRCDHCVKGRKLGYPLWYQAGYRMKCQCDKCGYTSKYPEQFNVFYIDGEPSNCHITNLKTVCANCQRILHILKLPWRQGDLTPDF